MPMSSLGPSPCPHAVFLPWLAAVCRLESAALMIRLILLPVRVAQRFSGERCAQVAAALSFSTLLGLVPMVALAAALITRLPFAAGLSDALEKFLLANLLPDKAGAVIAKYAGQFAHKAERVQLIGAMLLAVTALMQMLTIERTFNAIWRVKENRPLLKRLAFHLLALLFGPLLFGGSIVAITFVASVSFGFFDEPGWLSVAVFRGLSLAFTSALFAAAYWALPAKNVLRPHAMIGGLFPGLHDRLWRLRGGANFPALAVLVVGRGPRRRLDCRRTAGSFGPAARRLASQGHGVALEPVGFHGTGLDPQVLRDAIGNPDAAGDILDHCECRNGITAARRQDGFGPIELRRKGQQQGGLGGA